MTSPLHPGSSAPLLKLVEAGELVKEGKGRYSRYRLPLL
jgi:hypothetical protein